MCPLSILVNISIGFFFIIQLIDILFRRKIQKMQISPQKMGREGEGEKEEK